METNERVAARLMQALHVMNCEFRTARSYGTPHKLSYSDMGLLQCVRRNRDAKSCELSQYLGITGGAVTQLAKKLADKGYLKPTRAAGNRKEVYYVLTEQGEDACRGYDRHYGGMAAHVREAASALDEAAAAGVMALLDAVIESVPAKERCAVRPCTEPVDESKKRCEKCQRIF